MGLSGLMFRTNFQLQKALRTLEFRVEGFGS